MKEKILKLIFALVIISILVINYIFKINNTGTSIILFTYIATCNMEYYFTKKINISLIASIICYVVAIISFIRFFI